MATTKKETKPVAKAKSSEKKATPATKSKPTAYHVSTHKEGGYQVKGRGSDKALKRFDTQAEAIAHAKKVSKSQDAHTVVHSKTGKIRKA